MLKFLEDALVGAEIIIDDNFTALKEVKYSGYVDKDNPRIEIDIIEKI